MNMDYITRDDIESHEAALQPILDEKRRKQEAIDISKKKAIKAAEDKADQELAVTEKESESQLSAMQRNFECLSLLRQVYHEGSDDLFELILSKCNQFDEDGWGKGGLNAFRLANKRCKQVVESCVTMIVHRQEKDGQYSLPDSIMKTCRRIERISLYSRNLRSLEGCPRGLKRLIIVNAPHLSDLSPLATCTMMERLGIYNSSITDISVVASIPLLEEFICLKDPGRPSIKDLSPLSSCTRLRDLWLYGNNELQDLIPLSACTALGDLEITDCPFITSLAPLSSLKNLTRLDCQGIDPTTFLLPLASCSRLKHLYCSADAVGLEDLRLRRPDIQLNFL